MKDKKDITVVVAMSGGVDSSVAAALLNEEGYNLIGITMKTWGFDDFPEKDSGCCSLESIYNARNVANQLGIPHYTLDFTEKFNDTVINNFVSEYMKGNTPNPCVLCNKVIKWGALLEKAISLGADFVASGHYTNLNYLDGRYFLSESEDKNKDQSYALWQISQFALSKTMFPVGKYTKPEIRKYAKKLGLKPAETPDSQEICFVPDDDYRKLLEVRIPDLKSKMNNGDIVYKNKVVGKHKGYPYYTIGQRRGLEIALGKPVYVTKIKADNNIIEVGDEDDLYSREFIAKDINLMKYPELKAPLRANVKIRYKDTGSPAVVKQIDETHIKVVFDEPKKSITPGQSSVFYEGDDLIGGGIIQL